MDAEDALALSAEGVRTSSWGGPAAWAELRGMAEDARVRTGFAVSAIEVLRADGLLEEVVSTGIPDDEAGRGQAYPLSHVHRVMERGERYGRFVFLAEEDMDPALQEAIRGYGYVPSLPISSDPRRWRALDMLVARVADDSGRTRVLFHLDEPLSGRRPRPHELQGIADSLELALQAIVAIVDREELTRKARLDATARAVVREASQQVTAQELLAGVHPALVAGFRARSLAVWLHDEPGDPTPEPEVGTALLSMRPAIDAATRRAWAEHAMIIVDTDRVWGDDELDRDHRGDLTRHLRRHGVGEVLLVPVGAGHEPTGVLVVARDSKGERWTGSESAAALGVGHDLGRALLSTRAHERERRLIEELQRLDAYRRQLVATVSHELRNPLGVISGHIEMLESLPHLPSAAETSLRALRRGSARLGAVVDDLLLLSQTSSPKGSMVRVPIALDAVLVEVIEDEAIRAGQHGVELRQLPLVGRPVVPGVREELRAVLVNLVSNAVKYSRAGGTVKLSLAEDAGNVVFTCADDGIGISAEDRRHLFEEFFRSTNPEALHRPGTGLGLAIAAQVVTRHGGRIDVESELGAGTTFRVTLPDASHHQS